MGRKPCCDKVGLKRGPWTVEEDHRLMSFIVGNGIHCWRTVPKLAGLLRCGKSCRLRWINYLRPDLKRGGFTEAEDDEIIRLHQTLGNRWSKIASHFVGRTDNEIKNHWNTKIKKRLKESCVGGLVSKKSDENRDTVSEAFVNKLAQNDQTKDVVDNDEDDLLSNYEIFNGSLEVIDHWLNEDSIEDLDAQSSSASFQESLNASISDSGVRDGSPYLHQWFDEMDSFLDAQLLFSQLYQL